MVRKDVLLRRTNIKKNTSILFNSVINHAIMQVFISIPKFGINKPAWLVVLMIQLPWSSLPMLVGSLPPDFQWQSSVESRTHKLFVSLAQSSAGKIVWIISMKYIVFIKSAIGIHWNRLVLYISTSVCVLRTQNAGWILHFQHFSAKKLKKAKK